MDKTYCMKCMRPTGGTQMCPYCGHIAGETALAAHVLRPGTILDGRYILGEPLGQGGFGITYIGRDLNLDIRVAIKEYFPSGYAVRNAETSDQVTITDERLRLDVQKGKDSFLKEARTLAQFKGTPGIVDVLNFFEANDTAYIVMEYLDGETLAHRLKRELFGADDIFRLMEPVFDTLEKIHQQGVVHRDISPDNIMILPDGRLKLMDFGAARLMNYSDQRSVSVVLKAGYAPLEQYSTKGEQGPWTDIYALCATIYKSITKITPPDAHDRLMGEEIRWPSELGIPIPIRQEAVLKKGMEIRQKDRFQTIGELQAALREETSGSAEIGPITWKPLPKDATVALPKEQSVQPMKEEPDKEATSKSTSDTGLPHNERQAEPKQPENKKKPAIWAVCATLVLAAAALGIVLLTGRDKQKPTEETVSAQTTIQSALFSTVQATFEPSAVGTENVSEESNPVLTEMPALTPFSMPDLMGKTMEEAYEIIVELGLVCSDVTQERNIEYSGGQIIRQSPDAGGLVYQGTSVSIVVTPVDQLTDAERIDKRRFSVVSSSDSSSKFLCAFADRNDRLWKWDSISKEVVSTGIVGIKELTQSLYYLTNEI